MEARSAVFHQPEVDGVLAVLALEDADRRGNALGDPDDGLVRAAVGAGHAQRSEVETADGHGFRRIRDPVGMVADTSPLDETITQDGAGTTGRTGPATGWW